jgi:hypothetical protein
VPVPSLIRGVGGDHHEVHRPGPDFMVTTRTPVRLLPRHASNVEAGRAHR